MKISKEFKIGAIAILVFIAVIWGYNFLKGKNILSSSDEYYVEFERIDGLIESGNVFHKGYKVGNINSIYFDHENSGRFILKIVLEQAMKIPLNSTVNIKSSSLIASASDLEIVYSNSTAFYTPGDTLKSVPGKGMADILEPLQNKFESVLEGIDTLLAGINTVLNNESQDDLQSLISDLSITMGELKYALGPNGDITKTLANLESVTGNLAENNEEISNSLSNLESITSSVDSADLFLTITTLNESLAELSSVLTKIDEGEGSLGLLVNDSSLYTNLDSTAYHLDKLLVDLKENPNRYVQVSVFGKKDK